MISTGVTWRFSPASRLPRRRCPTCGQSSRPGAKALQALMPAPQGSVLLGVVDAAGAVEALLPVAQVHAFDADRAAGGRGVDELVVAEIDADVRETAAQRVVKHQVAGLQVLGVDLGADP